MNKEGERECELDDGGWAGGRAGGGVAICGGEEDEACRQQRFLF